LSCLIKLEAISKRYRTGNTDLYALQEVTLRIESGEMMAIMGASGSGKSTLMNILGFLDQCTSGTYLFQNRDVSRLKDTVLSEIRNAKVGFVFQAFFLLPRLTALQNVMLPLFYREETKSVAREKSLTILDKVGMRQFAQHKPNQLSGGQQQRVAIARALVGNPDILFADEPTGALDSKTGNEVMDIFLNLNHVDKKTVVIVTHDTAISDKCQRTVFLKDGKLKD